MLQTKAIRLVSFLSSWDYDTHPQHDSSVPWTCGKTFWESEYALSLLNSKFDKFSYCYTLQSCTLFKVLSSRYHDPPGYSKVIHYWYILIKHSPKTNVTVQPYLAEFNIHLNSIFNNLYESVDTLRPYMLCCILRWNHHHLFLRLRM